uniref:Uncharacterized protein n=1 Tax=Arundo donax TaxID=35708 RepID=A0A0A9HKD8_ARUDO
MCTCSNSWGTWHPQFASGRTSSIGTHRNRALMLQEMSSVASSFFGCNEALHRAPRAVFGLWAACRPGLSCYPAGVASRSRRTPP